MLSFRVSSYYEIISIYQIVWYTSIKASIPYHDKEKLILIDHRRNIIFLSHRCNILCIFYEKTSKKSIFYAAKMRHEVKYLIPKETIFFRQLVSVLELFSRILNLREIK